MWHAANKKAQVDCKSVMLYLGISLDYLHVEGFTHSQDLQIPCSWHFVEAEKDGQAEGVMEVKTSIYPAFFPTSLYPWIPSGFWCNQQKKRRRPSVSTAAFFNANTSPLLTINCIEMKQNYKTNDGWF